jgi:signal peptidase I
VLDKNPKEPTRILEGEETNKPTTLGSVILNFFEFIKTVIIIVILAAVIRLFVIQPFIVDGQSMEPNFQNNDYLITEKISFHFAEPKHGETVILRPPDNPSVNYLKRIIGVPGDTVNIKNGDVYLNGKKLDEPYIDGQKTLTVKNEEINISLKQDEYFVMGDNRNHSRDSREIGPVPRHNLISHVWIRLFPFNKIKLIRN